MGMKVGLVGVGCKVPNAPAIIKEIKRELKAEASYLGEVEVDEHALDDWRRQYDAEKLLKGLNGRWLSEWEKWGDCSKLIGVTSVDLFVPGMNFVFGLAAVNGKVGLVSTARLGKDRELKARLPKEVLHELGHIYGLQHCEDTACVMNFSDSAHEVDIKDNEFCKLCKEKLKMSAYG